MTARRLMLVAAAGSLGLLLAAWAFQHLGGLAPCKLCIWQRWPHGAAVALGAVALAAPVALVALLGAIAAGTSAGIGLYHTGVERGWWEGPSSCSSTGVSGLSADDLLDQIMTAPLVRCDEVPWEMLGLSMASWNAVASIALCLIWLAAVRRASA